MKTSLLRPEIRRHYCYSIAIRKRVVDCNRGSGNTKHSFDVADHPARIVFFSIELYYSICIRCMRIDNATDHITQAE